jgi:murein L,D-transpeptidase YafK
LIRATVVRALTASAVIAGALTLAGCYGDDGYQLPTRAMKELSPEMLTLLDQKNMPKDSPVLIRIFKEESELEVWKQDSTARYELLKVYPICRWSGAIGPKVREGDRQAPEGFYAISPGLMNPNSSYYLAINIGFPNAYDKSNGYSGAFLMIHGDCSSRGCYAMTDEQIGEIYSLARESFLGGQKAFQIQAYPFRMTAANLARHRNNPAMPFWKMIKVGNDHFEVSHLEPKVDVCEKRYVFDAQPPANSTKSLAFTPSGRCPVYETDPQVAEQAMAKQQNDDYQLEQLSKQNVAMVPLETGTDGGMNHVFMSKLENPTYSYDNEGHLHVPPLQPGRLPPQISAPSTSTAAASGASNGSSVSGFFGGLFGSRNTAPTRVATTDTSSQTHTGFFGSLFGSRRDSTEQANPSGDAEQTATTRPAKLKSVARNEPAAAAAGLRPRLNTEPQKSEPQVADTTKPKTAPTPQKEANVTPPPPSNNGNNSLLSGAQPVVPAGSFSNRWGGFQ